MALMAWRCFIFFSGGDILADRIELFVKALIGWMWLAAFCKERVERAIGLNDLVNIR